MTRRACSGVALCLAVLALAACAAFGPRILAPTVTVLDVRLDRIESLNAFFVASVELANPNEREISVQSIEATLSIEGEPVATASLAAPLTLAAGGRGQAEIVARTGVDAILRAVANAMRRMGSAGAPTTGNPALRYQLEGVAQLGGGIGMPFRRSGELRSRPARSAP